MDKIAVLIPCYNEEMTIGKVVDDWRRALPEAKIYVYNNNSTDRTVVNATEHGAIVRNEYLQGKGNVIRRMFREIDSECYIIVDGDDTYPAEYGPHIVDMVINRQADMVIGDRLSSTYFTENKRKFHNSGNVMVRSFINNLFHSHIQDVLTGYRGFSYQFVKTFPIISKGFEIETEMTIHAVDKNMYVENLIIEYRDRPDGSSSKLNTYSDGLKVLKTILKLFKNYKPMRFFGIISLLLFVISLCMFIPIFVTYIQIGLVPRIPTLIVSCFIAIAALLSLFGGVLLDTMKQKNYEDFEFRLQQVHMHLNNLKQQ